MKQKEIKNCKDYSSARKIVKDWNKEDSEYHLSLDDYDGRTYYWTVGHIRIRCVRRKQWKPFAKNIT